MIRTEVEKLRGYTFTEEEVKEIINPAMPVSEYAKLGYLKYMIRDVRKNRPDIDLAFSCNMPYNIAVSRKMNIFGKSNADALKFVKKVFTEAFSTLVLDDGTTLPASFNIEKYSFNVTNDTPAGCTIEVSKE